MPRVSAHAERFALACAALCRSGLVSRKGCAAAPAICAFVLKSRGCCAALSRHKAAPTRGRSAGQVAR
ncbi:hypothetical protein CSW00_19125 [Pseudomonas asiatica]|nr:hypothetical protein CSW00_19125 [Pseudomonas sp. MR 02]